MILTDSPLVCSEGYSSAFIVIFNKDNYIRIKGCMICSHTEKVAYFPVVFFTSLKSVQVQLGRLKAWSLEQRIELVSSEKPGDSSVWENQSFFFPFACLITQATFPGLVPLFLILKRPCCKMFFFH